MDLYAVFGNPIGHSKSPFIHSEFAKQTGEALEYTAVQAPLDSFAAEVEVFFNGGGKGINVTVPFKEQAWQWVQQRAERAELAGAVNTIYRDSSGIYVGDNTDGKGLVTDLQVNNKVDLANKNILVLGAGGAVKGVLKPLLDCAPKQIVIANRTVSKAEGLQRKFAEFGSVRACSFADAAEHLGQGEAFDVIINGTSASLAGDVPPISGALINADTVVYDMMYSADLTAFNAWAKKQGALQLIDGLGMLVEQAAESFYLWRGVRPDTAAVMASLRAL